MGSHRPHRLCAAYHSIKAWSIQTVSALSTAMVSYALITWVYEREHTAISVTWLTICTFLPTILFLYSSGVLQMWQIYLINVLLSFVNALQTPAAFVATSLLVPSKHYARISGLQGFSGAAVSILAPALGSSLLAFGGIEWVLMLDLYSFAIALTTLSFGIRIPEGICRTKTKKEPLWKSCTEGFRYLQSNAALLRLTLFMSMVNFLAKMGNDGMLAPFVLARAGGNQQILGAVQSSVSHGVLVGSLLADYILEPLMAVDSPVQRVLTRWFGAGSGAGIALLFFIVDVIGAVLSLLQWRKALYQKLNE